MSGHNDDVALPLMIPIYLLPIIVQYSNEYLLFAGNNSMALSVGSKVEAKDFGEIWHPALIAEVDYDEMEVLVHYDNEVKK